MACYLADRMRGKAGLDSRRPFAETVQFMYSRFETQTPSRQGRIAEPTTNRVFNSTLLPRPCTLPVHLRWIAQRFALNCPFFLRRKLPKFVLALLHPPPQLCPRQNDLAHTIQKTYRTEYMLVFAKVSVKSHVSKHTLGHVRSRQPRYLLEN